jgi:RND superfamily putative drug exporter
VANLGDSDARAMPTSMEVRQGYDAVQSKFDNNEAAPVTVVAEVQPERGDVRNYLNAIERLPNVARLTIRPDVPHTATVIDVTPRGETAGPQSRDLVRAIRAMTAPFRVTVGGPAAELVDYEASVDSHLPVVLLMLILAAGILLFVLTGSVIIPIKSVLLNVLTLGATLGVLVVAFQWGWASHLLGFQTRGLIDLTTPLLLFIFVIGLTMDYEVFLLARIKEEWDRRPDNDRAVRLGIGRTSRVVTTAALCITVVFLGFVLGGLTPVKEVGFGMAVAIVLDVTVVRGLLLPAVMSLLGDLNWWAPSFLRRPARLPAEKSAQLVTTK